MSIFDDVAELLDPAGVGYKLMTSRTISGAPVYPDDPTGTLAPAYVLRKSKRILGTDGDEIVIAGQVYAPADPILDQTAVVVLPEGDRKIVSSDVYQDNDAEPGSTPFQVIMFQ